MGNSDNLGKILEEYIKKSGLTKKEFAKAIGVDSNSITNWTKHNKQISLESLNRIIKFFVETAKIKDISSLLLNYSYLQNSDFNTYICQLKNIYEKQYEEKYQKILKEKDEEKQDLQNKLKKTKKSLLDEKNKTESDRLELYQLRHKREKVIRREKALKQKEKEYEINVLKANVKVNNKELKQISPKLIVKEILESNQCKEILEKFKNLDDEMNYNRFKTAVAEIIDKSIAKTIKDLFMEHFDNELNKIKNKIE